MIKNRLKIEVHNEKKIIFVDYTGLKEKDMIELIKMHLELTLQTKLPFLADFNKTYVTTKYVNQARIFIESTKVIIDKGALLGIDKIKAGILKGILSIYYVNYKSFNTKGEALNFLQGASDWQYVD